MRHLSTFFRRRQSAAAGLCLLILGATLQAQPPSLTVPELVRKAMKEGEDSYLHSRAAGNLRLPKRDYDAKQLEAPQELCEDGLNRHFSVILSRGKKPRPAHLWWHTIATSPKKSESYDFRASREGRLLEATRTEGLLDSEGNVIQPPGVVKALNPRAPEVLARFQRELDFWLKGLGRKKKR